MFTAGRSHIGDQGAQTAGDSVERVRALLDDVREDPFLSAGEVAVMFGVSRPTVNRWVHDGQLPEHRTLGGHYRFRLSDVMSRLESVGVEGAPASDVLVADA